MKDCPQCGNAFQPPDFRARRYCSLACANEAFYERTRKRNQRIVEKRAQARLPIRERVRELANKIVYLLIHDVHARERWERLICNKQAPAEEWYSKERKRQARLRAEDKARRHAK